MVDDDGLQTFVVNVAPGSATPTPPGSVPAILPRPVVHHDPQFGELAFDSGMCWFLTRARWNEAGGQGIDVELCVDADEDDSPAAALDVARALWKDQATWDSRVRDHAVQKLLPRKNERWLAEGEAESTPGQFRRRMTLLAITTRPDGSFEFEFDDGGLFRGHLIDVEATLTEGPTRVSMNG